MNEAEKLLDEIDSQGIDYTETTGIPSNYKGLYFKCGNNKLILLNKMVRRSTDQSCVLAEELGHYYTSVGDIIDQTKIVNQKQEKKARRWAHRKLIPLNKFVECFEYGCRNRFETADYLGVTEAFLEETIESYKEVYGTCAKMDEYVVYFEPLGVMKTF